VITIVKRLSRLCSLRILHQFLKEVFGVDVISALMLVGALCDQCVREEKKELTDDLHVVVR